MQAKEKARKANADSFEYNGKNLLNSQCQQV